MITAQEYLDVILSIRKYFNDFNYTPYTIVPKIDTFNDNLINDVELQVMTSSNISEEITNSDRIYDFISINILTKLSNDAFKISFKIINDINNTRDRKIPLYDFTDIAIPVAKAGHIRIRRITGSTIPDTHNLYYIKNITLYYEIVQV